MPEWLAKMFIQAVRTQTMRVLSHVIVDTHVGIIFQLPGYHHHSNPMDSRRNVPENNDM